MIIQAGYLGEQKACYMPGQYYNLTFITECDEGIDAIYLQRIEKFISRGSYTLDTKSHLDYLTLPDFLRDWQVVNKDERQIFNEQQEPESQESELPSDIKDEIDKSVDISSLYLIHRGRPKWQQNVNFIKALSVKKAQISKSI